MSIANWNPTAFYIIGDEVYDGSADYYVAVADNFNDPPPSPSWVLIPPPPGGITGIITPLGSGLTASVVLPNATLSTNLVAGSGITLTPSGVDTSLAIAATAFTPSYASFYSTLTQPLTTGAETLVSYNGTFISTPDITLTTPTTISIGTTGIYSFLYSVECDKLAGGGTDADVEVYIRNAVVFPNSSSRTNITNATEVVLTCEYILPFTAGETIRVGAYTTGTNVRFPYYPPLGTAPATPSVITNVKRIA